jgi:hypothetical protein
MADKKLEEETQQSSFTTWMAKNSGQAIVRIGGTISAVTFGGLKCVIGTDWAWALGGAALAFGIAYKVLSKPVVDNFDDPYNNLFVTSAKQDIRDPSRIVVSGVIFMPRPNKAPVAYSRQFSIAGAELAARGLNLGTARSGDGAPTHIISVDARGRYVNLGFVKCLDRTLMMPNVVRINKARPLDANDVQWYEGVRQKSRMKMVTRTVLTMGSFYDSLAPD